jgi:hypothetical protein
MRSLFSQISRGVVAMAVVVSLAMPVYARPTDEGWSPSRLVKMIKRFVVKTLGDGITVPRP